MSVLTCITSSYVNIGLKFNVDFFFFFQSKEDSILELLSRADSEATSTSAAELREARSSMSETLAEAWKDLNHEMDLRQSLLDQNVAFHESAKKVWPN